MSELNIIIKFETIGFDFNKSPIVQYSEYYFDMERFVENPYTYDEIYNDAELVYVSVNDQKKSKNDKKLYTEKDLDYWKLHNPSALSPDIERLSLKEFEKHINERSDLWDGRVWVNSFYDLKILERHLNFSNYYMINHIPSYIIGAGQGYINTNFNPIEDDKKISLSCDANKSIAINVLRMQKLKRVYEGLE